VEYLAAAQHEASDGVAPFGGVGIIQHRTEAAARQVLEAARRRGKP
jgi:hypothetical protein